MLCLLAFGASCASREPTAATPPQSAAATATTAAAAPTPTNAAPLATASATPTLAPAIASSPTPAPTAVPSAPTAAVVEAADDEEECRKACHTIDLNALFGLGARHQPTNHKGYTVCLECHAALTRPALPATHLGRQDPACPLCHLNK
ncbi:MAG: hypothetical protein ACP5UQ_06945 [Anaerolineae bacterium]